MKINENYIEIEVPKHPKKITGTRFAAVLGYSKFATPFKAWCEITRTYSEEVDNMYTRAGIVIEPKIHEYLKNSYYMNIKTPTDVYGENYMEKTSRDFYPHNKIFGGMWDALVYDEDGKPDSVVEIKTTSRVEDWNNNGKIEPPDYYCMQASLYAYLLGLEKVIMVCSFLEDKDYSMPEMFEPSVNNTVLYQFNVHDKYPNFDLWIEIAQTWYSHYVLTGRSPIFTDADKDILRELQTKVIEPVKDVEPILEEAANLKAQLDSIYKQAEPLEKRFKAIKEQIKQYGIENMGETDKSVRMVKNGLKFTVNMTEKKDFNKSALTSHPELNDYFTTKTVYTLLINKDKGE